jgi:riboflavin synthase
MFTGIIEGLGTVLKKERRQQGQRFTLGADFELTGTRIGDSIAVNGACLTAVSLSGSRFEVDVSPETLAKTVLGRINVGQRVNLERALRLGDRLDGHLVAGHVDGVGMIKHKAPAGNAIVVTIEVGPDIGLYLIAKGSVAVDGISLTVNSCSRDRFEISIIPHTARETTIDSKAPGDVVNIETDMIGKYVERFVNRASADSGKKSTGVDLEMLARNGFM